MTALNDAREHLRKRLMALDDANDWRERSVIEPLYDVADMVCRIGDHPDAHYRTEKANVLLHAALRLYTTVMADFLEDATSDQLRALASDAHETLRELADKMWQLHDREASA